MPHSLYLGSDLVKARLRDYDIQHPSTTASGVLQRGNESEQRPSTVSATPSSSEEDAKLYRPSLQAITSCLSFSIWELAISLFTFALFVNSAILIVAGSSLYALPSSATSNADLFAVHSLLSTTLAPVAATIFALALLLSGSSAGIVCTMAGQIVSEGQIRWRVRPWVRRLATRAIAIVPSIIIAAAVGREGLSAALNATQVVLSVVLPVATAPLIWFCARADIMRVVVAPGEVAGAGTQGHETEDGGCRTVVMRNHWAWTALALVIWLLITTMNAALIVLLALGKE